jgi:hypothetical protein
MTDKLRQAAEMALEALERSMEAGMTGIKVDEAISAIRTALKKPLKRSDLYRVAVAVRDECHKAWVSQMENWRSDIDVQNIIETTIGNQALNQLPDTTKMIEEPPNSTTDVVESEPVAWGMQNADGQITDVITPEEHDRIEGDYTIPLYTAPPKREWQGLTDEEIEEGAKQSWVSRSAFESSVWWAEAKLKEKNHGQ